MRGVDSTPVNEARPDPGEPGLPAFAGWLRPLVDRAAGVRARIHAKLLAGFLAGALLLLGMGILNLWIIHRMDRRVAQLTRLQEKVDRSRQMELLVTAQSHFRGMALLLHDDGNNDSVASAKRRFTDHLDAIERLSGPEQADFFRRVRAVDGRYAASSERTLRLYRAGDLAGATRVHLEEEHPISHELEAAMRELQRAAVDEMTGARAAFDADRTFSTRVVAAFSGLSLSLALLLGFVLSWSFILPVRRIESVLRAIAGGDFTRRASVPNRDEMGGLADNVNATSARLAKLWGDLRFVTEHLQAVVDSAMDAIITVDHRGLIRSFNPAAERIFGYAVEDVVGRPAQILLPDATAAPGAPPTSLFATHVDLVAVHREATGRRRDGNTFPMELAVGEMPLLEGPLFVAIVRDITERKRAQEELALARDAALDASRAKSAFVANISHELRTPLNAIIGYSEMLAEEVADVGQDVLIPSLEKINSAGRHLLGLINAVLDLSKIEAGKMELFLETFEVRQLVQDVGSIVEPLVARNHNRLVVNCPDDAGSMNADATKVRQSLFNLLSNACKFTERGTVTVDVRREAVDGTHWMTFRVSDTGIGMTPDQLARLFQAFSQAEASTSRKYGGTGLGLALSRRFCQMMGGDITVESEVGAGTAFTMRLPADVGEPMRPLPAAVPGRGGNRVLVIDDDPAVRDLLERMLTRDGFQVRVAAGGEEGLRLAREQRPDAITLDVMMPDVDGWSVLAGLKSDPDLAAIPVVMLTITDERSKGYALGVAEYLTKPIEQQQLLEVLGRYRGPRQGGSVLVVEDDAATRQAVRRALAPEGWQVTEAENGRVGLERVAAQRPDLILLDLGMPEMDGFEFVEELRRRPEWRPIPVFVITARDLSLEDRQRLSGYVEAVVQKSEHGPEELLAHVRRLVAASIGRPAPRVMT
jgi:PAS domain S-box-containing protein